MKWFLFFSKLLDQIRSNKMELETQIQLWKVMMDFTFYFQDIFLGGS